MQMVSVCLQLCAPACEDSHLRWRWRGEVENIIIKWIRGGFKSFLLRLLYSLFRNIHFTNTARTLDPERIEEDPLQKLNHVAEGIIVYQFVTSRNAVIEYVDWNPETEFNRPKIKKHTAQSPVYNLLFYFWLVEYVVWLNSLICNEVTHEAKCPSKHVFNVFLVIRDQQVCVSWFPFRF